MKILFFGDIVGRRARNKVYDKARLIAAENDASFIVANAENSAHGFGLMPNIAEKLLEKVDVITLGDHTNDRREIEPLLKKSKNILRPANWDNAFKGKSVGVYKKDGKTIVVISLIGTLFMNRAGISNPFAKADEILNEFKLGKNADAIFIDFHTEATSEKSALAFYLDGRVSAVIGTHTHIETADERVLPNGTAFQTDAGACYDMNSIIGMKKDAAIARFLDPSDTGKLNPAEGEATLHATLVEIAANGLAKSIKRITA